MMMDSSLFNYLRKQCKYIEESKCILTRKGRDQDVDDVDVDKYDSRCNMELTVFIKLINLYSQKIHPFISELQYVWYHDKCFYIETSSTKDMKTLASILPLLNNGMLFAMLTELCTALQLLHMHGVHHGGCHENMIFMTPDMKRIYIKGIACMGFSSNFTDLKKIDERALAAMLMRISKSKNVDMSRCIQHIGSDMNQVINEMRSFTWTYNMESKIVLRNWQQSLTDSIISTHEIKYPRIDVRAGKLTDIFLACIKEFITTQMYSNVLVLPIFVDSESIERGASACVPIINMLFDFFVINDLLVSFPAAPASGKGLFPKRVVDQNLKDSVKYTYTFMGYLIAYAFTLNIPLQCQLSPSVIAYVMDKSTPATSGVRGMGMVTDDEKQVLLDSKLHLCCMRAGAAKITELPFYGKISGPILFDFFYNCAANVSISELGPENLTFEDNLSTLEKSVIIQWLRLLDPMSSIKMTLLIANSPHISKNTANIVFKKNSNSSLFISTCDKSVDFPHSWLLDVNTLLQNMSIQMNDLTFNKI